MDRHIFLIGFMGSGKTYWGQVLARETGHPFLDLDALIEAGERQTIGEIFAASGEPAFRSLEREYLHRLAALPPALVAAGGGTPCFFDNMEWMKRHGLTIYLETPLETLAARLEKEREHRPLLKDLDAAELAGFVRERLAAREPYYRQADVIIKQPGDAADILKKLLALAGSGKV